MSHEKPKDRAPEVSVFDFPPEPAGDNFTGELLASSQAPGFTVAQGLGDGVMVGCMSDEMLHVSRERQGNGQSAKTGSASKGNGPGLLAKRIRSRCKGPNGIHESANGIEREEMESKRAKGGSKGRALRAARLA